jgi:ABC-2 type transport system permease protein
MISLFKDLYLYRELLKNNIIKDFRGKYKKSFLGVLWSFLSPLMQLLIYSIVFPLILKVKQENYVIFLIVALIPWTFFATTLAQSTGVFPQNANVIKKVYFPREILPLSMVTSNLVNFVISSILIFSALIISGIGFSKYVMLFPWIVLIQYILILGASLLLSAITVYLRDMEYLVGVFLMMWFYITPVVYSIDIIPVEYQSFFHLNPMTAIITAYRDVLYLQQMPNLVELGYVALGSFALLVIAYYIFRVLQRNFAEEL